MKTFLGQLFILYISIIYCNVGKINKDYKTKYIWVNVLFNQTINYLK